MKKYRFQTCDREAGTGRFGFTTDIGRVDAEAMNFGHHRL